MAIEYYDSFQVSQFEKFYELVMKGMNIKSHTDQVIVTVLALIATFTYVLPVAWVYVITKAEKGFDESNVQAIILLAVIVTGVMMVVQDSLARAFGLVAILSAVRYRVAVKDIQDATYIFLSIAIGVSNGLNIPHIAIVMSLFINMIYLLLWKWKVGDVVTSRKKGVSEDEKAEINTTLKMAGLNIDRDNIGKKFKSALVIISRDMEFLPSISKQFDKYLDNWEFYSVEKLNSYENIYKSIVLFKEIEKEGDMILYKQLEDKSDTILLWKFQRIRSSKNKLSFGEGNDE
jgi:hypothetical protein